MIAFIKIVIVFVFMLLLLRRKIGIGITMLVACIALGLLFQLSLNTFGGALWRGLFSPTSVDLVVSLMLILFLECTMRKTLLMQRMVQSVMALAKDQRIAMAVLPAFIGLLPSVGGAVFSAPMVEEASRGLEITAEMKSFINYWYRHLWEYILPLYPAIILTSQIQNLPISTIVAAQVPLSLAAMLVGIPIAFRSLAKGEIAPTTTHGQRTLLVNLSFGLAPIIVVMFFVLVLKTSVSIALFVALAGVLLVHRFTPRQILGLMREAFSWNTLLLACGIVIFKEVIATSGAVEALPAFFAEAGIPVIAVVFALPFIVGLISGASQATVAITFPIVVTLGAGTAADPRLMAFAFASGFAGVMTSPAHLCLVLTVQHFRADFGRVLRMVVAPQTAVLAVGMVLYLVR
ncbi:MAG: DUF401 family protein [Chloroflexi bacterium]|nr:DUF401 family protein [Chloroflexota bacterium]